MSAKAIVLTVLIVIFLLLVVIDGVPEKLREE